jgi:hypothetical protein
MTPTVEITYAPAEPVEAILALIEQSDEIANADDGRGQESQPFEQALLCDPRTADQVNNALAYLEALATMTAGEIARQQARQRAIQETAATLQRATLEVMAKADTTKIHGQHVTLMRKLNPPSVRIEDPEAIPAQYTRQPPPPPPVPDKTAIKRAIESGTYVPGAALTRGARLERT